MPDANGEAGELALHIQVQEAAFDTAAELARLVRPGQSGAQASFTGFVRDFGDAREVCAITLEHYPGMTEAALHDIAQDAARRWPLHAVSIVHRVGHLALGEAIVFVGVTSAHRRAAFAACEFIMDMLKTRAPFWKKEHCADGSAQWVAARHGDTEAAHRWQAPDDAP
ncbi:MAG: molybdopterin synthase catalytic subunit MoaE [Ottowia sp.]|nr:molybdopterin synthase catalytic subunit MoaE [Ottowia sp.]